MKTVPLFWGALWGLLQFVQGIDGVSKDTYSAPLFMVADSGIKGLFAFALNYPFEFLGGHILAGFFWAIIIDAAQVKNQLQAKKTKKAIKARKGRR